MTETKRWGYWPRRKAAVFTRLKGSKLAMSDETTGTDGTKDKHKNFADEAARIREWDPG